MRTRRLLPLLLLAAAPALAQFEGVLESKMTGPSVAGTTKSWVSKVGVRMEMTAQVPQGQASPGGVRTVVLHRFAEPDLSYFVNDAAKTYSVIDARQLKDQTKGAAKDDETYAVKKAGKDSVAGFSCDRASVTGSKGTQFELCVSNDILGGGAWIRSMQRRSAGEGGALVKAMQDAGVEGYPVRWVTKDRDGGTMTVELVSAKRQAVPASTFEVPAGYKKSDSLLGTMSPDAERQMKEAMERMTPEQRKMLEEMMKKQKGGQ